MTADVAAAAVLLEELPTEWERVLRDVDTLIDSHRLAPLTLQTYDSNWSTFSDCVAALGHPALPTTTSAVVAFLRWVSGRDPLRPSPCWSASYVEGILAAVADRHQQHGFPNPLEPFPSRSRQDLRRILKRALPVVHTVPVTPQDLRALVSVPLPRNAADAVREVGLLLHLRTGLPVTVLRTSTVRLVGDVLHVETATGTRHREPIVCTCSRSDVLLDSCLRCAVEALPDSKQYWQNSSHWVSVRRAAERADVLQGPLDEQAFVLAHTRPRALTHLRMRAWILLGYDRALRGQDLRGLLRRDLRRQDGLWRARVRRGKNDPYGETTELSVKPQADALVCPVAALDLWLAVRDAATDDPTRARGGYAFCPISGGRPQQHTSLTRAADLAGWARRCQKAGVVGLSQHGLRTGFIVEAARQGNALDAITYTARQSREQTTTGSYLAAELALRTPRPIVRASPS